MKRILNIGEAMGLFVADTEGDASEVSSFTRYSAGAEMNVAIGLSRLGFESYYMTALGQDPFGKYIEKVLLREKVKTDYVDFSDTHSTGFMIKEKTSTGDPKVYYYRKGSAASHMSVADLRVDFSKIDHVHLAGISVALSEATKALCFEMAKKAKENGIPITFDPNLRPSLWKDKETMVKTINELAALSDIVMPGIGEGEILVRSTDPKTIAEFYLNQGARAVVIKLGAEGAYINEGGEEAYISGYKVAHIVDTVGAGDGFATGVISGLVSGLSLAESVKRGNAIGAIQLGSPSDNEGLPTMEELLAYMG